MQARDTTVFNVFKGSEMAYASSGGLEILEKAQLHQPAWYFIYFILLIGLFAWIRLYYGNILVQTVQASVNFRVANRAFMDNSLLQNQLSRILYLFYFLNIAFLLFYTELKLGLSPYELQAGPLYLFNLALLMGIFLGRLILINITGFLFNRVKMMREYLHNIFIFNKLSGLIALPLMFLLVYTRGTLQGLFFIFIIFVLFVIVIMRLIRGLVFSYKKEVLFFYMFLYLCALEIAPLVLLYKWLEGIL